MRKQIRRVATVLGLNVVLGAMLATAAFATSHTDPTGGAGGELFTDLQAYLTTTLIPAVIGLAIVGVAVSMLLKWGKRAAKSS